MKSILMKSKELRKYRTSKHTNTVINPTAFARQAIFLMLMMFMSVGSAWGDTVKPNTPTTTTDCGEQILSNSNEFTITGTELVNIIGFTPNYLRVYATDGTDLVQISNVTGTYREYVNCGVNGWVCSRNDGATGTWQAEFKVQLPSNAKKLYLCASSTTVSVSDGVYNEPADVKAYFFSFITESEVTFISASESLTETQIDIPYSSDPVALDLYTNYMSDIQTKLGSEYLYYFYCRWYLRNASTKTIVDMTNTTFGNYSSVTGYSYAGGNSENNIGIIWKSNDLAYNQRFAQGDGWNKNDAIRQAVLKNVTWTSPNTDYEVVCVMSASEPTMVGSKVWKEPTLQAKYVFHMEAADTYVADLKSGATTVPVNVEVNKDVTSHSLTELKDAYSDIAAKLTGTGKKYARIYVANDDGTLASDQSAFTITMPSGWTASANSGKYGQVFYADALTAADLTGITIASTDGTTALYDVGKKVAVVFSSDMTRLDPASPASVTDIISEPQWEAQYIYSFSRHYDFTETGLAANAKTYNYILESSASNTLIVNMSNYDNQLYEDFVANGGTYNSGDDNFYFRWYVRDKSTGTIVPATITSTNADSRFTFFDQPQGLIYYHSTTANPQVNPNGTLFGKGNNANLLNKSITLPAGYTFSDVQLVCNIAQDVSPVLTPEEEMYLTEPEIDMQYVFSFMTEEEIENAFTLGSESTAEERKITLMVDNETSTATADLSLDQYRSEIMSKFTSNYMSDFYLRWYIQESEGYLKLLTTSPFAANTFSGSSYSKYGLVWNNAANSSYAYSSSGVTGYYGHTWDNGASGQFDNSTAVEWAKVFKTVVTRPADITSWKDCKIVCVMTNDVSSLETVGDKVLTEPPFKLKYVFTVLTVNELDDAFTPGDDSGAETVNKVIEHTATTASVNLNNYFDEIKHKLGDITDLSDFYLRWYLVKNGTEVEDKTVYSTGGQLLSFDGNYDSQSPDLFINKKEGKIFYEKLHSGKYIRDFTTADQQGAKNVTFTLPSGDNWSDYKIVCVMTDAATEGGVDAANGNSSFHGVNTSHDVLITEPTIKLKYVFEMKTEDEIKAMFTVSDDASTKLSGAYQGVKLLDDGTATSIDVDLTESGVFADWSKTNAFGDDTETDQFVYARFLLVDKNGAPIDMTNYTLACNTTLTTGVRSQTLANNQLVIYAPTSGFTQDLLNIKVTTTGTPDWTNVRLAVVIANDATGLSTANDMNYTSTSDDKLGKSTQYLVINEPTEFFSAWTCKFVTDAEDLFVEGVAKHERTIYQKIDSPASSSFTVNLSEWANKIAHDLDGKTKITNLSNLYLRCYVESAGQMVNGCTFTGADGHVSQRYGLIWYNTMTGTSGMAKLSADPDAVLNPTITLPSGYTQEDVSIVFMLTDDLTGVNSPVRAGLTVSSDPTNVDYKYILEFITEDAAATKTKTNYVHKNNPTATETVKVAQREKVNSDVTEYNLKSVLSELYAQTTFSTGAKPSYMRVYLLNASGSVIEVPADALTGQDGTILYQDKGAAGLVWAANDNTSFDANKAFDVKLDLTKLPAGTTWDDVQVACVLTNDLKSGDGGYLVGTAATDQHIVMEEPAAMDAKLIVSFKNILDDYSSTVVNKSYEEVVNRQHFDTSDASLDITSDYKGYYTDMQSVFTAAGTELGGGNFYVRWYLTDKEGDMMIPLPEGITITPVSDKYQDMTSAKGYNIGKLWYSKLSGAGDYTPDLLKATVSVSSSDVDLNNYQVRCVMTFVSDSDTKFDAEHGTFSSEPDLQVSYTYKFQSDFAGKLIDDAFVHTEEILIPTDTGTGKPETTATVALYDQLNKIVADYRTNRDELGTHLHIRWYVTYKGKIVDEMQLATGDDFEMASKDFLTFTGDYVMETEKYGYYLNTYTTNSGGSQLNPIATGGNENDVKNRLNSTFTNPNVDLYNWNEFKVIVVLSDDISAENGQVNGYEETWDAGHSYIMSQKYWLEHEPENLNMLYYYSFFVESAPVFVHSKGESERDYITPTDDTRLNSEMQQYSWDNGTSSYVPVSGDIRQGVHTYEYNIYIDENGSTSIPLTLPAAIYTGNGDVIEPKAYFRWYDWETDMNNTSYIEKDGSLITDNAELTERGFFVLNNSKNDLKPTQSSVGVKFKPSALLDKETIYIACDVSKYYDGIYQGSTGPFLLHEPTLSERYIFCLHRASTGAKAIKGNANDSEVDGVPAHSGADNFEAAIAALKGGASYATVKNHMFNLFEDNGRTVVSVKDNNSVFVVRANLANLPDYYFYDGSTLTRAVDQFMVWNSYYEDSDGNLWMRTDDGTNPVTLTELTADNGLYMGMLPQNKRISPFNLQKLSGSYKKLSNDGTAATMITASPGMRFHLVGKIGSATTRVPACHYELRFVESPAYRVTELPVTRRDEYLARKFKPATADKQPLNFDELLDLEMPMVQTDNFAQMPLSWSEAAYGFCYPSAKRQIWALDGGYIGISPLHGDYMLLKSMNFTNGSTNVSDGWGGSSNADVQGDYYKLHWWNESELFDYTHLYNAAYYGDESKYGTFFYVDAADESRTMAKLYFDATLCKGAELHFTMAIADMTEAGKLTPQVCAHVWEVDANGNKLGKVPVISFLTCELNSVTNDGSKNGSGYYGNWWQVYGYGTLPSEGLDGTSKHYMVEVDNYSRHTDGADYCIDQIMFYTNSAQVNVKQTDTSCNDEYVTTDVFMPADNLDTHLSTATDVAPFKLYWRICDDKGNVLKGSKIYSDTDTEGTLEYGTLTLTSNYELTSAGKLTTASEALGYKMVDGIVYLYLTSGGKLPLKEDRQYYVSVYVLGDNPAVDGADGWGTPSDLCSLYSSLFSAQKSKVEFPMLEGLGGTVGGSCSGGSTTEIDMPIVVSLPDQSQTSGFLSFDDVRFDFFIGTKEEYDALNLSVILDEYRTKYPNYVGLNEAYADTDTPGYYEVLKANENKLLLTGSTNFVFDDFTTAGEYSFIADAIDKSRNGNLICSPILFTLNYITGGAPELVIGFDDVDYSTAGAKRVIRVGLEQLNKMRTQNYKLHIPVNMYKDKNGETAKKVYFSADSYLVLSETNDPTQTSAKGTAKFAHIVPINSGETRPYVDKTHMYLSLDLSSTNCGIDFHEGYEYEVATTFHDEDDESDLDNACIGDLFLVIKVVPEFVTWEAQHVDNNGNPTTAATAFWSANWYNDGNWQRSTRDVLYKDQNVTGKVQNTATAGHPAGYDNNGEGTLSSLTAGSNPGFVPMKFTYVTLPTGNHAPSLINEPRVTGVGVGSRRQGGGFLDLTQTTLLTDRSPRDPDGTPNSERTNSKPTENIYYDMLVRYSYSPKDPYGEGCFGHRYMKDDGTWADQGEENMTAKVFDVEKFQGNICREIYFKPGAELLRQQRLTYEKAWVETELEPNKWYLLASPLLNTYAGDMYVPTSMTNVVDGNTVVGRQVTEAFQPITFDKTKGYSRTNYPIYQHSWGLNNGTVYVKENDLRANSYSANLNFGSVTTSLVEWGHTFNDVQVPYSTMRGFSIRAHKKLKHTDGTTLPNTLIRLPKADTNYDYYEWNDNSADPAAGNGIKAVSKPDFDFKLEGVKLFTVPKSYRLVTDEDANDGDLQYSISAMQQNGDYVLVGNPYMVSIDMKKFFADNSNLDQTGYWTYEASAAVAHAKPTLANTAFIKPMQGFFVKKGTATDIVFNRQMQVDGNFPPQAEGGNAPAPLMAITLSAQNNNGSSSATVAIDESSSAGYAANEDVETLFDSNLADVPMVYTVSEGKAVTINHTSSLQEVCFGVTCNSDEMVDVTFDGVADDLYVYDALTGESVSVGDGSTITVQPNDYGRYFLTSTIASPLTLSQGEGADVLISVRSGMVTVTATNELHQVRALSVSGATVYQTSHPGTTCQFQLQQGTYVIETETLGGRKTMKVLVK